MATSRKQKPRFAIVVSRFNDFITQRLLEGCLDEFSKNGVSSKNIHVVWVPGAFEIPVTALKLAKKKKIDAVICLGSVIRGETYHYELVAQGAAQGIQQAALLTGKPVIMEVLATDTVEQAQARAQADGDNKGRDAAQVAMEMMKVFQSVSSI